VRIRIGGKGSGEYIDSTTQDRELLELLVVVDSCGVMMDRKRGKREWYASYLCLDVDEARRVAGANFGARGQMCKMW